MRKSAWLAFAFVLLLALPALANAENNYDPEVLSRYSGVIQPETITALGFQPEVLQRVRSWQGVSEHTVPAGTEISLITCRKQVVKNFAIGRDEQIYLWQSGEWALVYFIRLDRWGRMPNLVTWQEQTDRKTGQKQISGQKEVFRSTASVERVADGEGATSLDLEVNSKFTVRGPIGESGKAHKARSKSAWVNLEGYMPIDNQGDNLGLEGTVQVNGPDWNSSNALLGPKFKHEANGHDFRVAPVKLGATWDNKGNVEAAVGPVISYDNTQGNHEWGLWGSSLLDGGSYYGVGAYYEFFRGKDVRLYAEANAWMYNGTVGAKAGVSLWDRSKTLGFGVWAGTYYGVPFIEAGPRLHMRKAINSVELKPTSDVVQVTVQGVKVKKAPIVVGYNDDGSPRTFGGDGGLQCSLNPQEWGANS